MSLPAEIPLRHAAEDAGYVSMQPVVRQTFRLSELVDMVVRVVGKDPARVQQIFRSGTVLYNGYRYWWESLSAELGELESLLLHFPDDDPSLVFDPAAATAVLFEMGGGTQRNIVEILRLEVSAKPLFGKESPWAILLRTGTHPNLRYEKYSYARKADLFRLSLPYEDATQLLTAMLTAAPRKLRYSWTRLRPPSVVTFVVPRGK